MKEALSKMEEQMNAARGNKDAKGGATVDYTLKIAEFQEKLPVSVKDSLVLLEKQAEGDESTKKKTLEQIVEKWTQQGTFGPPAYYLRKIAELEETPENWEKTGDQSLLAFKLNRDTSLHTYWANQTAEAYEKALELEPENLEVKVKVAQTYVDVKKEVMRGVFMLREVVAEDSMHINANLSLGKLSVFSGQYDKAVTRLKKVLKSEENNSEALYYMGEAELGLGNKETSLEYFQKCRELVQNPAFREELDRYINKILQK